MGSLAGMGYGRLKINGKSVRATKVCWELVIGEVPKGINICHHCDNPRCVNPDHLFLGSQKENMRDMITKGRASPTYGTYNGRSVLDNDKVLEIRKLSKSGNSFAELGRMYGVNESAISRAVKHITWGHLA